MHQGISFETIGSRRSQAPLAKVVSFLSFRHLNFPACFTILNIGKSSPISIVPMHSRGQQGSWPKDGSFGSAILRGVGFDSVGNNSGPNSWTDDRASELQNMTKQLQDARRNNLQVLLSFILEFFFTSCLRFPEVFRD